jgi:hypothetical protein
VSSPGLGKAVSELPWPQPLRMIAGLRLLQQLAATNTLRAADVERIATAALVDALGPDELIAAAYDRGGRLACSVGSTTDVDPNGPRLIAAADSLHRDLRDAAPERIELWLLSMMSGPVLKRVIGSVSPPRGGVARDQARDTSGKAAETRLSAGPEQCEEES